MSIAEFVWNTVQTITQKKPTEIKVLLSEDFSGPFLQKDQVGFVLQLGLPNSTGNSISLNGVSFPNSSWGRETAWDMFKASLYHLCIHSLVSDFSIYFPAESKADTKSSGPTANQVFSASIVEDFAVRAYIRALWPGLLENLSYANYYSALLFKKIDVNPKNTEFSFNLRNRHTISSGDMIAANLLSHIAVGKFIFGSAKGNLLSDIKTIHAALLKFEDAAAEFFVNAKFEDDGDVLSTDINNLKVALYQSVTCIFEKYAARLSTAHSLLYTERYGPVQLFNSEVREKVIPTKMDFLDSSKQELGIGQGENVLEVDDESGLSEGEELLEAYERSISLRAEMVKRYSLLDPGTHLGKVAFPSEDYAEYVRIKRRLAGPISTLFDRLNVVNFSLDEATRKESGEIDIQTAIQNLASWRSERDYFNREELLRRNEAWTILIDSSKSVRTSKQNQVMEIGVCLSEIASKLMLSYNTWSCLSFNENLFIVKDFEEKFDKTIKGRVGALPSGVQTLLPDALRIAARRLSSTSQDVKVLLVVSDGYPLGYEGIEDELIRTIRQIRESGMLLLGLGVGSSAIKKYFQSNCVIEGPYDLMEHFVDAYVRLPYLVL